MLPRFLVRAIVPGVAMSEVYFVLGPTFVVSRRTALAHYAIPLLFRPPG